MRAFARPGILFSLLCGLPGMFVAQPAAGSARGTPAASRSALPTGQPASSALTLERAQAPSALLEAIVQRHLSSFPGLEDARPAWYAPLYAPDGRTIDYYEVKLRGSDGADRGALIVSATRQDYPVVEFSTAGPSYLERFRSRLSEPFRLVRYGVGYIAAERLDGTLLDGIGERPVLTTEAWRQAVGHARGLKRVEHGVVRTDIREGVPEDDVARKAVLQFPDDASWYAALRQRYEQFLPPRDERLERSWARLSDWEPSPRGPVVAYDLHTASTLNHSYHVQLGPDEAPNDRKYYTGCGPTAWMNLMGYWDLDRTPGLLDWTRRFNDDYAGELTVELRDYLHTFPIGQSGCTLPWRMDTGPDFLGNLEYSASSYLATWTLTDSNASYAQGRSVLIDQGLPFIVGYYEDWHYAIALAVAESRPFGWEEESWIYLYPGWTTNDSRFNSDDSSNKWIPVYPNVFGVWSLLELTGAPHHDTPMVGDFNGDGLTDVIAFSQDDAAEVRVALSDGSSFGSDSVWLNGFARAGDLPQVGDVNGDGLEDVLAFTQDDPAAVWVALSNGSSFDAPAIWIEDFSRAGQTPRVGDFNGDGLKDVASFSQWNKGNVWVALSDGSSFGAPALWSGRFAFDGSIPDVGDFDGDGRDDVVAFSHDQDGYVLVGLSDGSRFQGTDAWQRDFGTSWHTPRAGDFNGDGMTDILDFTQSDEGDVLGATSRGGWFGLDLVRQTAFAGEDAVPWTGDVDGDGLADLIAFSQDGSGDVWVATSNGVAFQSTARWQAGFAR